MTSKSNKDWSGHKYTLIKKLGYDIDNIVLVKDFDTQEENWHLFSHAVGDGATLTHAVFDKYKLNPKYTPNNNSSSQVGSLKKLFLIYQHLKTQGKKITYPWKTHAHETPKDTDIAYAFIPMSQLKQITTHCKNLKVGETSFYLDCLDKAASQALLADPSDRIWVLPHDVRASLNLDSKSTPGNYAAALYLRLPKEGSDAKYINTLRKSLYKRSILWGSWAYSNITRFLPDSIIKKALLKMQKPSWFGVFSNVGNWESNDNTLNNNLGLVMSPFASDLFAVTSSVFCWENCASLALTLNPELVNKNVDSKTLAKLWITEIFKQTEIDSEQPQVNDKSIKSIHAEATRLDNMVS